MTHTANQDIEAARYVSRIRNNRKRAYASAYLAFRRGEASEPDHPAELSYMGAQAVRIALANILGEIKR